MPCLGERKGSIVLKVEVRARKTQRGCSWQRGKKRDEVSEQDHHTSLLADKTADQRRAFRAHDFCDTCFEKKAAPVLLSCGIITSAMYQDKTVQLRRRKRGGPAKNAFRSNDSQWEWKCHIAKHKWHTRMHASENSVRLLKPSESYCGNLFAKQSK